MASVSNVSNVEVIAGDCLLTVAEAAEFLRVSHKRAWKLINDGCVPSVRLGGTRAHHRILRSDLLAFVVSQRNAS